MKKRFQTTVTLGLFLVVPGSVEVIAAGAEPTWTELAGDYAGWAYLEDGSDFPLRLHINVTGGVPEILIDAPHQKAFGLSTSNIKTEEGRILFERRNRQGNLWTYELTREDRDNLRGKAALDGTQIHAFQLHRSAEPLRHVDPSAYAGCAGTYRSGNRRTIVISPWFWGELQFMDRSTGRWGTLFPLSDRDFFAGEAMYVPTRVFARLHFEADAGGPVSRLIWTPADGPAETLQRFESVSEILDFQNGDVRLQGTLVKPPGAGPHPVIVVLGGSDWTIRDQVRSEADAFVSMGWAAFIFDQRGHGASSGKAVCSFQDTASDVCAAAAMLRGRSDVVPHQIGVSGRSRGGWFAPLAASRCKELAYLVLFVPPAISPARQETTRRLNEMRAAGFDEEQVKQGAKYLDLLWKCGESDSAWDRYVASREEARAKGWLPYLEEEKSRDTEDMEWMRLNMQYDPVPTLERVSQPVLALFGELDSNVTPQENLGPMKEALQRGGNRNVTLNVIPGADHGLNPFDPANPRVPLHRRTGSVPQVWETVRQWLTENGRPEPKERQ